MRNAKDVMNEIAVIFSEIDRAQAELQTMESRKRALKQELDELALGEGDYHVRAWDGTSYGDYVLRVVSGEPSRFWKLLPLQAD